MHAMIKSENMVPLSPTLCDSDLGKFHVLKFQVNFECSLF
jgi:hypothetical protein